MVDADLLQRFRALDAEIQGADTDNLAALQSVPEVIGDGFTFEVQRLI